MGIHVDIQELESTKTFTPLEPARGSIRLSLNQSTVISALTVTLEGSVRTSVIKEVPASVIRGDAPSVTDETHKLFRLSKVLFPHANTPFLSGGYTLSEGDYNFPFEISFPLEPKCPKSQPELRHIPTVLPPSFEAHVVEPGAKADIEYILRIDVKRPGRLRKGISVQRKLLFSPLNSSPSLISSLGSGSGYHARQEALYINNLPLGISSPHPLRPLPILLVEARLPSPPVLYSEEILPLHLFVRSLPTTTARLPIILRSLTITLQGTITVQAGNYHTSWLSSNKLLDLKGLKEVINRPEEAEVLSEINTRNLQNVTIPKVTPSFTTCTVEQKHSLEVEAGFSFGETTKLMPIMVVINVEIWSTAGTGKPLYTPLADDTQGSEDSHPRVPLRPGCLTHLGVVETSAENRDPPPY